MIYGKFIILIVFLWPKIGLASCFVKIEKKRTILSIDLSEEIQDIKKSLERTLGFQLKLELQKNNRSYKKFGCSGTHSLTKGTVFFQDLARPENSLLTLEKDFALRPDLPEFCRATLIDEIKIEDSFSVTIELDALTVDQKQKSDQWFSERSAAYGLFGRVIATILTSDEPQFRSVACSK